MKQVYFLTPFPDVVNTIVSESILGRAKKKRLVQFQIKNLFDRLLAVKMEMLISRNETKWEKFGVDDSLGRHLQVFDDKDEKLIHYIFGNAGQDYQHNYIRDSNSSEVYRTNDNVYFLLNSSATYWGKSPPKPKELETDL